MNFVAKDFKEVVSKLLPVIPNRTVIPTLECFKMTVDEDNKCTITANNLETKMTGTLNVVLTEETKLPLVFLIPAKTLSSILKVVDGDTIEITLNGNTATLTCEKATYDLLLGSVKDYPADNYEDYNICTSFESSVLVNGIRGTEFCTIDTDARPVCKCVHFVFSGDNVSFEALDGFRLGIRRGKIKVPINDFSVNIPAKALAAIVKTATNEDILYEGNRFHSRFKSGNYSITIKNIVGDFVATEQVLPKDSPIEIKIDRNVLAKLLAKSSVVLTDKAKSPLVLSLSDNKLNISVLTSIGHFTEETNVECSESIRIGLNHGFLEDAVEAADSENVVLKMSSPVQPCLVVPDDDTQRFAYLIFPIRLAD